MSYEIRTASTNQLAYCSSMHAALARYGIGCISWFLREDVFDSIPAQSKNPIPLSE
jgi:hypothetical protein